jgi:succinate dehydrogenase/fumarate reductase flavoprotein subunit
MTVAAIYDVVVVGGGAAGLTAASVAATEGARTLLVEGTNYIGGTTAISGGMVWIPGNAKMRSVGVADSRQAVEAYLAHMLPQPELPTLKTFLDSCGPAVAYLERRTSALRLRPVPRYPDYDPTAPGATSGGRVLEPLPFDGSALGAHFTMLRPPLPELTILGGMMVNRSDIPHFRRFARSPRSAVHVAKLVGRYGRERMTASRGTTLYLGNALAGRLLRSALDSGVELAVGTVADRLLRAGERVTALELLSNGDRRIVQATKAVILAGGGVSHDSELRRRFTPSATFEESAAVSPGPARSGARLALEVGGVLAPPTQHGGFWTPCSRFLRRDGSPALYPHIVTDRAKPGLIAVDQTGRRFVNEARSYHHFGAAQLARGELASPAYLICDRVFLWRYGLGRVKPFSPAVRRAVASGYLLTADTPAALASRIGVPVQSLLETFAFYNRHADDGADPEFGRGSDIYQRHLGDERHLPNPCVAPITRPPFFALPVYATDLGMSGGLITDSAGRVLDESQTPIAGLFACGNDMASVMQGAYPGPGITLGPALTFGYLAGVSASSRPAS